MPYAGFDLNSKYTDKWVTAIGKFMINFGGVEWTTYVWIETLAQDDLLKEIAADMPLSKRLDLIRKLLEQRPIPKKLLNESRSAWGTVEQLSKLRNDIAHNPVIFGWHGPEEQRAPDYIGSLNFRRLKSKGAQPKPLLEFARLNQAIDEAASAAQKLHKLLELITAAPSEA